MLRKLMPALIAAGCLCAADFPNAEISNGLIQAKILLPDAKHGYYQGTRFDWSGVIASLTYKGHQYFGQWFEKYDPKTHDAIMGPVEEFRTDDSALGYAEAKPGWTFVRIGVGGVRKPQGDEKFNAFKTYDIQNPGKWIVRPMADRVEFVHELRDESGYAYLYKKTVKLMPGMPRMVIEHSLKNTGAKTIDTVQYNHNFFMIDAQPTGPEMTVKFGFDAKATGDLKGLVEVKDGALTYTKEFVKGQSVFTPIEGFGPTAKSYDFRIENLNSRAGVHITGDKPLAKLVFWCIRTTACPEPYIHLQIAPGKQVKWTYTYDFYTLP